MSTFIDLDSIWRDREIYKNPADYQLSPKQVETWYTYPRSKRAHPQNANIKPLDFASSIVIKYLTIPYDDEIVKLPRVYVNFTSIKYKDIHLIHAIEGKQPEAKFICQFDFIQNDKNGDPLWIHYKSNMKQVMRFIRGYPILFRVTTRSNTILPNLDTGENVDAEKQILCTLEIQPYITDAAFDNHFTETHVIT